MKVSYRVVKTFTVNSGQKTIEAETVLSLTHGKALPLLLRDLIEPEDPEVLLFHKGFMSGLYSVTIKTETGRLVELVGNPAALVNIPAGRAGFLPEEVEVFQGFPRQALDLIIDSKVIFPGSMIDVEATRQSMKTSKGRAL